MNSEILSDLRNPSTSLRMVRTHSTALGAGRPEDRAFKSGQGSVVSGQKKR